MHTHSLDGLTHSHAFLGERHEANERRIWIVVGLTLAMMGAEIVGGTLFGSLALVADGWHMGTHAAALAISAAAYRYARRHSAYARFAFGTGKLGGLAGYTSAVVLTMIALLLAMRALCACCIPCRSPTGRPSPSPSRPWAWRSTWPAPGCCEAGTTTITRQPRPGWRGT